MTFKTQAAADIATVFFNSDEFAESATYNGTSITVVPDETTETNTNVPGFTVPLYTILVKKTDVTRPKAGDTVIYDSVTCRVTAFPAPIEQGGVWRIGLEKETIQA